MADDGERRLWHLPTNAYAWTRQVDEQVTAVEILEKRKAVAVWERYAARLLATDHAHIAQAFADSPALEDGLAAAFGGPELQARLRKSRHEPDGKRLLYAVYRQAPRRAAVIELVVDDAERVIDHTILEANAAIAAARRY